MLTKKYIILLVALIGISIFNFNIFALNKQTKMEFTNPVKPIIVKKSQSKFSIILQSNPTTGYVWALKSYDNTLITPVKQELYPAADKKIMGAPGYEKWTFRIKDSGFIVAHITNISLAYLRSWETQDFQTTTFKVITQNDD